MSAVLSAPWRGPGGAALIVGACGLAGIAYSVVVARRAVGQTGYKPVLEDWVWHVVLPFVSYALLLAAAGFLPWRPAPALFGVAAATLLLLYIGIHNAWDAVVYLADKRRHERSE